MKLRRMLRIAVVLMVVVGSGLGAAPSIATIRRAPAMRLPDPVPCSGCYAPALHTSWQWQLQGTIDRSIDVDLYDVDGFETSKHVVDELHADGRKVICYLSAGSWEKFRPDAGAFPASVKGKPNGWPGERWLDIRRLGILGPIMKKRFDMCAAKGFDAIEFDNIDGYQNHTGFPLTGADQLRYNTWLANQAHRRGLSGVLKNDLSQIPRLLPYFDFALNEQCHQYHECGPLSRFVHAGKAVFGVEYRLTRPHFCPQSNAANFNFLRKKLALRVWRRPCRGH